MIYFLTIILSFSAFSADKKGEGKVIYEFKKYERIDLGSLQIKGNILAPGDITVTETDHDFNDRDLYIRKNFNDMFEVDLKDLR